MLTLGNAMYLGIFPRNNQPRILGKNHHPGDFICFHGNNGTHIIEEFGIHLLFSEHSVKKVQLFCQATQMDAKLDPLEQDF